VCPNPLEKVEAIEARLTLSEAGLVRDEGDVVDVDFAEFGVAVGGREDEDFILIELDTRRVRDGHVSEFGVENNLHDVPPLCCRLAVASLRLDYTMTKCGLSIIGSQLRIIPTKKIIWRYPTKINTQLFFTVDLARDLVGRKLVGFLQNGKGTCVPLHSISCLERIRSP